MMDALTGAGKDGTMRVYVVMQEGYDRSLGPVFSTQDAAQSCADKCSAESGAEHHMVYERVLDEEPEAWN